VGNNSTVYLLVTIGVIYGDTRGTGTATFQDEKVKNLLLPAAHRGDLRSLNYNKTVFGRGSAPDPAGRAHDTLPDPRVR